ncbi:MAG: cytochrome b N-terminal domain-containing protein [Chloroflexi bacterium]|nr:cytochrome b N-terminal domain-containing protein [Chloroflexota bacterium]
MRIPRPKILSLPFLDDIEEKGVVKASTDLADDVVKRVTAGLNISDVRSVLRGDPPARPNPRLTPHADGFWFHIRPGYYSKLQDGLYPTFRLGWLATFFFAWEILTGIYLMIFYTPSPIVAYENMLNILSNVPFGRFMRDTHKLGGELMVLVVAFHMVRTYITGSYKRPRQFTWATGGLLLIFTLFVSFFGYLLPWDQLSLWAITIGTSAAEATPFIGREAELLLLGGTEANFLLRSYLYHVILIPIILIVLLAVHYYKVIIHGNSLPPEAEDVGVDTARKVPMNVRTYFMPKMLTRELVYVAALTLILLAASAFTFGYHAPLEPHADQLVTPLHTTSPWYFLWVQGLMKLGDKLVFGIIIPFIIVFGLLVAWPYMEVGRNRRYGARRIGLSIAAASVILAAILTYMGTHWFGVETSPDQEAVAVLLPQTRPGPLRLADWDDIPLGTYAASKWEGAPTPTTTKLLKTFHRELDNARDNPIYGDVGGFMIVEDWQTDLKKITLSVAWVNQETGAPGEFSEVFYFHRNSDYGQGE